MEEKKHKRAESEESEALSVSAPAPDQMTPVQEGTETVSQVSEKIEDPSSEITSTDRDAELENVESEKRYALINAWEENEKAKVEHKTHKKLSAVASKETTKKAHVETKIKKYEEKMEKKKAKYVEKNKNKIAENHKAVEEKKAIIEAKRGENFLKVEETAARYRSLGYMPRKCLGCFSS